MSPSLARRTAAHSLLAALIAAALAPLTLQAQYGRPGRAPTPPRAPDLGPSFALTPYAGVLQMGTLVDGPFGSSIRPGIAPMAGGQLAVRLSPELSLVGNVAYGRSDLKVGVPLLGGFDVGGSSAWLYDAGLQLALPLGEGRVVPFLQAGGGAMTQRVSSGPLNVTRTNAAFNAGAGLDVPLGRGSALRLMAKDYVSRFDAGSVGDIALRSGVTHNVAVSAGLRLAF